MELDADYANTVAVNFLILIIQCACSQKVAVIFKFFFYKYFTRRIRDNDYCHFAHTNYDNLYIVTCDESRLFSQFSFKFDPSKNERKNNDIIKNYIIGQSLKIAIFTRYLSCFLRRRYHFGCVGL